VSLDTSRRLGKRVLGLALAASLVGGCRDSLLRRRVYGAPKVPAGFYADPGDEEAYYENTLSVSGGTTRQVLCTDDPAQARGWSEASNLHGSVQREFVRLREMPKYFEIGRAQGFRSRVDRCAYLDRSQVDELRPGSSLGVFNVRPITVENAKELVEYLWWIRDGANRSRKVLDTTVDDDGKLFEETMTEALIVFGADFGMCDRITISRSRYAVDYTTGIITNEATPVRKLDGECHPSPTWH